MNWLIEIAYKRLPELFSGSLFIIEFKLNTIGACMAYPIANADYFPIQKRLKITPNKSSAVNSPVISLHANWASRRCSANSSI